MKKRNTYPALLALAAVAVLILGVPFSPRKDLMARPQDQQTQGQSQSQQPSASQSGPASQPGETVLVPKKSTKSAPSAGSISPPSAPDEKKPEKINPKDVYTLSTTTNLVNVDVLVTDKDGNPIPSLAKTNFKVYDDG